MLDHLRCYFGVVGDLHFTGKMGHTTACQLSLITVIYFAICITGDSRFCYKTSTHTIKTDCTSCTLNRRIYCPLGYKKNTYGSGLSDCNYIIKVRSRSILLQGCRHICQKQRQIPECCKGYWGNSCIRRSSLF